MARLVVCDLCDTLLKPSRINRIKFAPWDSYEKEYELCNKCFCKMKSILDKSKVDVKELI